MSNLIGKIGSFVQVIRFGNLLILAISQLITARFLSGVHNDMLSVISDIKLLSMIAATGLIAAGGYIINDYYDVKIDYINRPDTVVVGKKISRRNSLFGHTLLTTIGVLLSFYASIMVGIISTMAAILLWYYSNQLKRWPLAGNISVSVLTGLSIFICFIYFRSNLSYHLAFGLFAFFISLIREIIKDIEDIKGDEQFGCKTLPILLGVRKTKLVLYGISLIFLISTANIMVRIPDLSFVFYGLTIALVILNITIYKADTIKDFSFLSTICKIIMIVGICTMMLY